MSRTHRAESLQPSAQLPAATVRHDPAVVQSDNPHHMGETQCPPQGTLDSLDYFV